MSNLFDLTGKVALVTGGNGGIGLGMAKGLASHGASIVIWGNKEDKNERAMSELLTVGGEARCARVNIADEDAVSTAMRAIVHEFGAIDICIANAGTGLPRKDMFAITQSDFEYLQGINVHGTFFTLREAAGHMIDRFAAEGIGGSLLAVASTAALHGAARNEHYGATKGAVVSLARAMAVELAPHNINVNSVLPGWTRSDLTQNLQSSDKFNDIVIGRVPMGRWATGADFAAIAVYLASEAARFHTGDSIVIDGGYTIY